ncbi:MULTISPECIES: helix-turn-helix domain-containing protein [unclassified Crossiella]|uniref:helix-turn-helix domain-containing protein n=1 Tax=unclassified Crossiella TaxID=2620835 RepID=UPI001FFEC664|nr:MULTISPECIES: helix-turn-helix domain-containing protein [unclassified Crossiella]MCK2239964.1 helix-turn-helix domain-containing protein [Crossiella sp. S99.2]MCK2252672.1 helix-turn-helix domain-containing protein [Crossiella sp. S99.1]
MSVEAITWALNLAPLPADEPGQPSKSAMAFVLVALANHADPDGQGAFPSLRRVMRYTHLSERTVRMCVRRLETAGLIRPANPKIVAAYISRADRRPNGWDLALHRTRSEEPEADGPAKTDGGQSLPPVQADGGQPLPVRGAATAPEPSLNHQEKAEAGQVPLPDMPQEPKPPSAPLRCPAHRQGTGPVSRCRQCADLREAAQQSRRSKARAAAAARAEAARQCRLCDEDGYRGAQVCNHVDPDATAAARARAREAFANRSRKSQ